MSPRRRLDLIEWGFRLLIVALVGLWLLAPPARIGERGPAATASLEQSR